MLARWESVLTRLEADPMQLADELDWVAKLRLLEGYRERDGLDWDSPRLELVDLQYADVRPDKGLYHRLVARGRDEDAARPGDAAGAAVRAADRHPGLLPRRVPAPLRPSVAAASWDSVIFDVGRESLVRVPMVEPLRGHEGPRRRAARPVPGRGRADRRAGRARADGPIRLASPGTFRLG